GVLPALPARPELRGDRRRAGGQPRRRRRRPARGPRPPARPPGRRPGGDPAMNETPLDELDGLLRQAVEAWRAEPEPAAALRAAPRRAGVGVAAGAGRGGRLPGGGVPFLGALALRGPGGDDAAAARGRPPRHRRPAAGRLEAGAGRAHRLAAAGLPVLPGRLG